MARPYLIKISKVFAFLLGGCAAVIILFGVMLALVFDGQAIKTQAARLMYEKKQRILKIDGDVSLSFWPSLGVNVQDVSLSERESEKPFASAQRGHLSVRLLPLLTKSLAVDTVDLEGVQAHFVQYKNGRFNFDDLLTQEKSPFHFDIARVRLSKGDFVYEDERAKRRFTISDLELSSDRLANVADGQLALKGLLKVNKPEFSGDLQLFAHYRYDLHKQEYALDGLEMRSTSDLDGMKGAKFSASAGVVSMRPGELDLIKVLFKGEGGEPAMQFSASVPKLTWQGERVRSDNVSMKWLRQAGNLPTKAEVELHGLAWEDKQLQAEKCSLAFNHQDQYRLRLSSPLQGQWDDLRLLWPKAVGELEILHPRLAVKPLVLALSGQVQADVAKSLLSVRAQAQHGESHAQAELELSRWSPWQARFKLDVDQLNVDRYWLAADKSEPWTWADGAGQGSVRIGALHVAGVQLSDLRSDVTVQDGQVRLAPMSAKLYQGQSSGELVWQRESQRWSAKQSMQGIAWPAWQQGFFGRSWLEGRGDLKLELSGQGLDAASWRRSLDGQVQVEVRDGAVQGVNLARSLRDLKEPLIQRQDMLQQPNWAEKTELSRLSARFTLAQGVASSDDLTAESPYLRMQGQGVFDLGQQQSDFTLNLQVADKAPGQMGQDLADLSALRIPVRIAGPFAAPVYRLRFADVQALSGDTHNSSSKTERSSKTSQKKPGKGH